MDCAGDRIHSPQGRLRSRDLRREAIEIAALTGQPSDTSCRGS